VYYSDAAPFAIDDMRRIAGTAAPADAGNVTVTGLYEWGPWVNGGAWLHTPLSKVDFLYRSLDKVEKTIREAMAGTTYFDYYQQPPFGFYSVIYLAETHICLPLYDPQGHLLDYRRVEELAGAENISLRTGCFCNPGAGEIAEGLTEEDMRAGFTLGAEINLLSFLRLMQERGHKSAGAIRASIGLATNFADVWRFLRFIAGFRDQTRLTIGDVSFDIESCRIIRDGS
jgi:hypothetical protein